MAGSYRITAPRGAELNVFKWSRCCSGPAVMTVIHCNGDTSLPLAFYPVCPPAAHSLSKYSLVLYLSLNIPAVSLLLSSFSLSLLSFGHFSGDIRQTVMEFFYHQSTEEWCMAPISPAGATWAAESLLGPAMVQDGLETPEGERAREREVKKKGRAC